MQHWIVCVVFGLCALCLDCVCVLFGLCACVYGCGGRWIVVAGFLWLLDCCGLLQLLNCGC